MMEGVAEVPDSRSALLRGAKSFWSRRLDLVQTVVVAVEVVNDDVLEICILTLDAERVAVVNKA